MNEIPEIIYALESARRVVVLTGAGISAESGVPTFRGKDGLWNDKSIVELARPETLERDPKMLWEFYNWRRGMMADKEPNPGHYAIARLEKRLENFALVTQNIDNLHRLAGSKNVLELHGNVWRVRCLKCGDIFEERKHPLDEPPYHSCGGMLRPDVVWFGEGLPPGIMEEAFRVSAECDVALVVGTSAIVYPAAQLPVLALQNGAKVFEINIEPTPFSNLATASVFGKSGEILPQIIPE
ncbi:MAG: SIR2 family NAD-dependent protein deacylase [Planctomycetota bacterium]|jgi:NAD-dependent deacetylase